MRIALVGTRGVPARYGGFETAVEEVGQRLVDAGPQGHRVLPDGDGPAPAEHLGMHLVHLPRCPQAVPGDAQPHGAVRRPHAPRTGPTPRSSSTPRTRPCCRLRAAGIPVATHVDGLEWQRASGARPAGATTGWPSRWRCAGPTRSSPTRAGSRTTTGRVRRRTELLAYGAPMLEGGRCDRLAELGLEPRRLPPRGRPFEPENHVDVIVEGYVRSGAELPLVVVGSAPYSDAYTAGSTRWPTDAGPLPGRRLGPGAARPAVRERAPPTCTATRWAAPTPRCCAPSVPGHRHRLRRRVQPRGGRRRRRFFADDAEVTAARVNAGGAPTPADGSRAGRRRPWPPSPSGTAGDRASPPGYEDLVPAPGGGGAAPA